MSRLTGWLRSGGSTPSVPSTPTDLATRLASQEHDLAQAMSWAEMIMNDDIDGACAKLETGDSVFHELGSAVTTFMRSVLGFEKSVMTETTDKLNHCETRAWTEYQRSQKLGRKGTLSKVYPPGTEFELVRAETMLMGAVVGVLHESVVEAMRSFYKLRKAFMTLDGIIAMENKIIGDGSGRLESGAATGSSTPITQARSLAQSETQTPQNGKEASGDSSDAEFVDAPETKSEAQTPAEPKTAAEVAFPDSQKVPTDKLDALKLNETVELPRQHTEVDPALLDNPIDKFIHSGANMCFGVLLLIITLIPPAFSRILSIVGFRGDRSKGIRMLWQASYFSNINGAMAALMLLAYYNAYLGQVDIKPADADFDQEAEVYGPPRSKCDALLAEMRRRYPDSSLWRVEEARSLARDRRIPEAIETLKKGTDSKMKQVMAIANFELALGALTAQDWVLMRDCFLRCIEVNDWSHTAYYFMAGVASVELYRDAVAAGEESEARLQKEKAEGYLRKAPTVAGRKTLMARKLPFETLVQKKMDKWEARAKEMGKDLIDVLGASPALEMAMMWNGQARMGEKELLKAEKNMSWERLTGGEEVLKVVQADKGEMGVWALGTALVLRGMEKYEDARALLKKHITGFDRTSFKGITEDYVYPTAVYVEGTISWHECCDPELLRKVEAEEGAAAVAKYRRAKADECEQKLKAVVGWENFIMDERIGIRVQSGLETLRWFRARMGLN